MKYFYLFLLLMTLIEGNSLKAQSNLYWTNSTDQKIQKLNENTQQIEDIVSSELKIAAPVIRGFNNEEEEIYWTNEHGLHFNKSTPSGTKMIFKHRMPVIDYTFDISNQKAFWCDSEAIYHGDLTTELHEPIVIIFP